MKRVLKVLLLLTLLISFTGTARANVYDFFAPDILDSLDHGYAYKWGINFKLQPGETITGASLTFSNIYNWMYREPGNILYVDLLNAAPQGVRRYYDCQASSDYFANQGTRIGTWTDLKGGNARHYNLVFSFDQPMLSALTSYTSDGNFGLSIDPDCHYYDNGVRFRIFTELAPVPEPCSLSLIGLGLVAFSLRRKFTLKK